MTKKIIKSQESKPTIFGEENFLDTSMIKLVKMQSEAIDNFILEEMENGVKSIGFKYAFPNVVIDKKKLENWVKLCIKLDNIDKSDLTDMATRKKIWEKDQQIAELKQQLADKDKCIERLNELLKEKQHIEYEQFCKLITQPREIANKTIEMLKNISSKTYERTSDNSEHIIAWLFTPMEINKILKEYEN